MKQSLKNIIAFSLLCMATIAHSNEFLNSISPSNILNQENTQTAQSKPVYFLSYEVISYHNGSIKTEAKGSQNIDESGVFNFYAIKEMSYTGSALTDAEGNTTVKPLTISDGFSFEGQISDLGEENRINLSSSFQLNHVKAINTSTINGVSVQTPDTVNFERGTSTNIPLDKTTTVWQTDRGQWISKEPVKELEDSPTQYKLVVTVQKL